MSGKTTKAAGQQKIKDGSGATSSSEVASLTVIDGAGHEPSVALSGHYIPVGSQPIIPGFVAPEVAINEVVPDRVNIPHTDDVVALEVRAVPAAGFWRCGRFWPREPVNVFASDDPEGDNAASVIEGDVVVDCFISHADAARLKAEPMLIVTVVEMVTEKP